MKKFTIVCSALFVVLFAGMVCFVAFSEDFTMQKTVTAEGEDPDSPIWDMSMEEVIEILSGQGFLDVSAQELLGINGLASEGFLYDGLELYWWDLENLDEDSEEYQAYMTLAKEGYIDIYNSGNIMNPKKNGPFALNILPDFMGDADAAEKAFLNIGKSEENKSGAD